MTREQQAAITCRAIGLLFGFPSAQIDAWLNRTDSSTIIKYLSVGGESIAQAKLLGHYTVNFNSLRHIEQLSRLSVLTGFFAAVLMGIRSDRIENWADEMLNAARKSRIINPAIMTMDLFAQLLDNPLFGLRIFAPEGVALDAVERTIDTFQELSHDPATKITYGARALNQAAAGAAPLAKHSLIATSNLLECTALMLEVCNGQMPKPRSEIIEKILSLGKLVRSAVQEIATTAALFRVARYSSKAGTSSDKLTTIFEERSDMHEDMAGGFCGIVRGYELPMRLHVHYY